MITIQCPRCDDTVRLPADEIPADAYGQCPLCRETFPASEIQNILPPPLVLIGADGEPLHYSAPAQVNLAADAEYPEEQQEQYAGHAAEPIQQTEESSISGVASAGVGAALGGAAALGAAAIGLTGLGQVEEAEASDQEASDQEPGDQEPGDQEVGDQMEQIGDKLEGMFQEADPGEYEHEDDVVLEETYEEEVDDEGEDDPGKTVEEDTLQESATVQDFMPEGESEEFLESPELDSPELNEIDVDLDSASSELNESAAMQLMPDQPSDLLVVEDPLEDTMADAANDLAAVGVSEDAATLQVAPRKRFDKRKRRSPIKTIMGIVAGPLIAIPLAAGILAWMGRLPNLGIWPADGSYNWNSSSTTSVVARDLPATQDFTPPSSMNGSSSGDLIPAGSDVANLVEEMQPNADTGDTGFALPLPDGDPQMPGNPIPDSPTSKSLAHGHITLPSPPGQREQPTGKPKPDEGSNDSALVDELMGLGPAPGLSPPPEKMQAAEKMPAAETMPAPVVAEKLPIDTKPEVGGLNLPAPEVSAVPDMNVLSGGGSGLKERPVPTRMPPVNDVAKNDDTPGGIAMLPKGPEAGGLGASTPFDNVDLDGPGETDSPELIAAVEEASSNVMKLIQANINGTASDANLAFTYASICKVGATKAPTSSTAVRELLTLIGQSTVLKDLGGGTPAIWLKHSRRSTEGIFLVGVAGTNEKGQTITLPDGQVLNVTLNRGGPLPRGSARVIALGKILDDTPGNTTIQLIGAMPLSS